MPDARDEVCIVGAGGHAKVAVATAEAAGISVRDVFDDAVSAHGRALLQHAVKVPVPDANWWRTQKAAVHIAIGDNATRARVAGALSTKFRTLIHPSAIVHPSVRIGAGSLICAGAIIQPATKIGAHCIINTGAVIEHDCRVGDFSHVAPASCVTGGVTIGRMAFLGAGTIVIPGIQIGDAVLVGAGAVVNRNLANGARVAGVPARPLSQRQTN
jgi:sugar O-acyltransferase (sialic acid O-acetyltransferase NeuD family)